MAINPHRKGGSDVPVSDGGTGASSAGSALSNLGGLDASAHALINHSGLPGVGGGKLLQRVFVKSTGTIGVTFNGMSNPPGPLEGTVIVSATITPISLTSRIRAMGFINGGQTGAIGGAPWASLIRSDSILMHWLTNSDDLLVMAEYDHPNLVGQTWRVRGNISGGTGFEGYTANININDDSWLELLEIED